MCALMKNAMHTVDHGREVEVSPNHALCVTKIILALNSHNTIHCVDH